MQNFRGKTPFQFGGTSWVTPGSFEDNLRALAPHVEDMELVLFDTQQGCNIPTAAEVARLAALCDELAMTCTVHFPVDICPSADSRDRILAEDTCLRMVELFAPLHPFAWVVHLVGEDYLPPGNDSLWLERTRRSAERLRNAIGLGRQLCVETLNYPFEQVAPVVLDLDLSVCLDVGHLIGCGFDLEKNVEEWLPRSRVVHLHGVMPDGTDHVALSWMDEGLLGRLLDTFACAGGERVVTIEVFEYDFKQSLPPLERVLSRSLRMDQRRCRR